MWKKQTCTLTTKDITILQTMHDRRHLLPDAVRDLLKHKLDNASVVFSEDIDVDVVTLNARVRYRIGDAQPQTAIITQGQMDGTVGQCLSLVTARGIAMLGLTEGMDISLPRAGNATPDRLVVEAVLFQPEAARRDRLKQELAGRTPRLVYDALLNS